MISHIDIIGALTYRTRKALSSDLAFMAALQAYHFKYNVFETAEQNSVSLWYFAGTHNEIVNIFDTLSANQNGGVQKLFPSIISYQDVVESHGVDADGGVHFDFDLLIMGQVVHDWTTEQRNRQTHKLLLEPIFDELMRQIKSCGWFNLPMRGLDFERIKAFTTGNSAHKIFKANYGYYNDYIQLTNLRLKLRHDLCDADIEQIEREAELVTKESKILNK